MTTLAYKAFQADFTCRSFQYEVGKTYTHDGEVRMCRAGFHACENPLDVLNYYNLCDSRFAVVELSGEILKHDEEDSKLCAATLHVRAELKFPDFVKTAVQCLIEACKPEDGELPAWLEAAVEQLNEVIAAHHHEPLSWSAGKQRVVLADERQA